MIKLAIKVEKADVSSVSSLSELIRPDEGLRSKRQISNLFMVAN